MQGRDIGMKNIKTIHTWVLTIFLCIIILDQATKYLVRAFMTPYRSLNIIPGLFNFVYVMNKGGAFGILSGQPPFLRGIIFISFSVITILALIIIYLKLKYETLGRVGIGFLMGGAIGNLIDRIRWGMVVDFLDFYLGKHHWPAFNIADMAICIGLGVILLNMLKKPVFYDQ